MRRLVGVAVLSLLLGACGNRDQGTSGEAKKNLKAKKAVLRAVTIEPEQPTVASLVRALPEFKDPPTTPVPLVYRWFVNDEEMATATTAVLPPGRYKRGDRVHCRIKPLAGGKEMRSKEVTVANAAPVFREREASSFTVPGEFFHQVFATDADGDTVTYHLISPLDRGIRLNENTGILRWRVEAPPPPPQPERVDSISPREESRETPEPFLPSAPEPEAEASNLVTLVFEARDGHGGVSRHSLELDLALGRPVKRID